MRKFVRQQLNETGSPKKVFRARKPVADTEEQEVPLSQLKGKELLHALQEKFPKKTWKPSVVLLPTPVVMVSCGGGKSGYPSNIVTVAWVGTVNSEPPMLSISLRPERYSHEIISATREFVVNLPTAELAKVTDWCGVRSGRDVDKFSNMRLTALPGKEVSCPIIADCPINIECKVTKIIPLGSHDMFLAKVAAVQVSDTALDKKGKLRIDAIDPLAYAHGQYNELGKRIGFFGFSVQRRK